MAIEEHHVGENQDYNISFTFDKNGMSFQEIMEEILMNKLVKK